MLNEQVHRNINALTLALKQVSWKSTSEEHTDYCLLNECPNLVKTRFEKLTYTWDQDMLYNMKPCFYWKTVLVINGKSAHVLKRRLMSLVAFTK